MRERPDSDSAGQNPLQAMMGGWQGAVESILPPLGFVATYAISQDLTWAIVIGLIAGVGLAIARVARGERPTRVLGALLVVVVAALFAAYTGSAVAYFWPLVLANVASALVFAVSILIRWPLLGVMLGPVIGTGMRWRKDPDLLRAYSRATWLWVLLNVIRAVAQLPFIANEDLWALAALRPVFYLLVVATVAGSWAVIRRTLPPEHLGIRHPHLTDSRA